MVLLWEVIFCSPKSCLKDKSKSQSNKDCECIFNLNFNKSTSIGKYTFSKPELRHSHALTPINIPIDGKGFIKLESDFTDPELTCIQNLALCYFSFPMLETNLERIFPGCAFDKTLLSCMRDKSLKIMNWEKIVTTSLLLQKNLSEFGDRVDHSKLSWMISQLG